MNDGVEVPIRKVDTGNNISINTQNNNTNNSNKLTYRTSLHLDNINQDGLQKYAPDKYISDQVSSSRHVTTFPNLQRNELTLIKDPNDSSSNLNPYTYGKHSGLREYSPTNNPQFYSNTRKDNYLYNHKEVENYYEITTITSKKLPSISGTVPIELNYTNLVHEV